jgi:DNA-binding response OmpR family regulator
MLTPAEHLAIVRDVVAALRQPPLSALIADTDAEQFGPLRIDYDSRTVVVDGAPQRLSIRSFSVLTFLARNAGRTLTREQLLVNCWSDGFSKDDRVVDPLICRLRRDLGVAGKLIVTVPTIGYRMMRSAEAASNGPSLERSRSGTLG